MFTWRPQVQVRLFVENHSCCSCSIFRHWTSVVFQNMYQTHVKTFRTLVSVNICALNNFCRFHGARQRSQVEKSMRKNKPVLFLSHLFLKRLIFHKPLFRSRVKVHAGGRSMKRSVQFELRTLHTCCYLTRPNSRIILAIEKRHVVVAISGNGDADLRTMSQWRELFVLVER